MSSDPAAPVAGTDVVERPPRRSDELPPGSTAYWEALTDEMQGDITALRARVAELEGLIRWVGECYPATLPWSGAQVELTWQQFNGMRSAIGLKPLKPVPRRKAPDPRDARIAELERLVAGFEAGGRVSFGDCSPEVQDRLGRIAELEATLREIERLTARTERDSRGDDRTIKFIADTARRALGDAHG